LSNGIKIWQYVYKMDNKQQLIDSIKDWVRLDNDIRKLQAEISQRKNEKKRVSSRLMETMSANNIDCFDIKDGQLCYSKRNIKKPITKKGLFDILTKYYNGDLMQATQINDYIIENREDVVKETLVRKIAKDNVSSS
jgi:hypothetical protein